MMGWLRDHSRIDSTKSTRPGSAHCRSSKTMTVGPSAAIRSKNVRQAEKSSSRSPDGASASPSRCARRGSIQRRSSGSVTNSATEAASLDRDEAASSDSLMPRPHPHHLAERPEGDALPVGGGAALVPVDGLGQAVDVLAGTPRRAGSCRCRGRRSPRRGAPVARASVACRRSLMSRSSSSRPTKGGSRRFGAPDTLALGDDPERPPGLDGLLLALQVKGARPR